MQWYNLFMQRDEHGRFIKGHEGYKAWLGKKLPDEMVNAMREANRGRKLTKEHIEKRNESRKKNNPVWHTEETKKKIGKGVYRNGIRGYRNLVDIKECSFCGSVKNIVVHHIDENRKNNNVKNLKVLCASCHTKLHRK